MTNINLTEINAPLTYIDVEISKTAIAAGTDLMSVYKRVSDCILKKTNITMICCTLSNKF